MDTLLLWGDRNFLEDIPKQTSWIIQKIMKASKYYIEAGYELTDIHNMDQFSSTKLYQRLRGEFPKVS